METIKLYKGIVDGKIGKKSLESFKEFIELLEENGHVLLSEYYRSKEKVLIDFKCGHEPHLIKPTDNKLGVRCPKCPSKKMINSKKEFEEVLCYRGHILLSEYVNNSTKVLVDFKCGHEPHWVRPDKYKKNGRCIKCLKKGKEYGEETLLELINKNNHELLSEYVNARTKVLIDFKCGHEPYWITPDSYKGGHGCVKCAGHCPEQAEEELKNLIKKNNHRLLSEYKSTHEKVLIDFNCGHEPHWITPSHYKNGRWCPKCPDVTQIGAKNRFLDKINTEGFELLTEYKTLDSKVLVDFKCGHEPHWITPSSILFGCCCPKCKSSKGVKRILKYLDYEKITYQTELRLDNDRYYDIYIPDSNLIVEVHGEQHYVESNFFKRTLEEEQLNDKMKEEYAKSLGYNYMVIDYKEHDPDLALKRFKNQFKKYIEVI